MHCAVDDDDRCGHEPSLGECIHKDMKYLAIDAVDAPTYPIAQVCVCVYVRMCYKDSVLTNWGFHECSFSRDGPYFFKVIPLNFRNGPLSSKMGFQGLQDSDLMGLRPLRFEA